MAVPKQALAPACGAAGDSLVVLLHGFGGSGIGLNSLRSGWWRLLPMTDFVVPDAPYVTRDGTGRQWIRNGCENGADKSVLLSEARVAFDRMMAEILAMHDMADRLDRVALVGFSQGAMMALDALASGRWPVATVVAFSGRLMSPPSRLIGFGQVMLIHGALDSTVCPSESKRAAESLRGAGVNASARVVAGLGHAISREAADIAGAFLVGALGYI